MYTHTLSYDLFTTYPTPAYIKHTLYIYLYSYLYLYIARYKLPIRVQSPGSVPGFPSPRPKRGHVRRTGAYCSTEIRGNYA